MEIKIRLTIRVIYANKNVIDSWINVVSLTGCDIATVTCPAIHTIEKITNKSKEVISVLCDIEDFITTVYVIRKTASFSLQGFHLEVLLHYWSR